MLATDIVVYVLATLRDSFWFQPLDNFDKCKVINNAKLATLNKHLSCTHKYQLFKTISTCDCFQKISYSNAQSYRLQFNGQMQLCHQ